MRLTLRTMLAYMDDILEPEDAQMLGKKIEESEFATNLLVRIRDVMRRLRLGAPSVGDRGAVLDPNTVAEYLDNTLSSDRVPDFEKVCLESDVHLAEVASCHQILTLVLGEPAEVDAASRQQLYQLPSVAAAQAKAEAEAVPQPAVSGSTGGDGAAVGAKTTPASKSGRPAVPDYLRDPPKRRGFWPVAATLFLAGFFAVVILAAFDQFRSDKPLGRLLGIGGEVREVSEASNDDAFPEESPETSTKPATELEQPEVVKPTVKPAVEGPDQPVEKAPVPEDIKPLPKEQPEPKVPDPGTMPGVTPPGQKPDAAGPVEPAAKPAKPEPVPGPGAMKPDKVDVGVKPEPKLPGAEKPGEAVVESPEAKPAEPAPVPEELLGRLVSENDVLLRLESRDKEWAWQRVPAQGSISSRRQLLALPTYRPTIAMTSGITLQLMGGTQLELLGTDSRGIAGLSIIYGRVVMRTVGKAGTQIRVQAGNQGGILTFPDADSAVAIAVLRHHTPGSDPEVQPDPVGIEAYATNGRVGYASLDGGQPVVINSIGLLVLDGPAVRPPVSIERLPEWISAEPTGPLDRRASATMAQAMAAERPARLGLKELVDHRQREVRWLAEQCLGYLGDYQLMVAALNNQEYRLAWSDYVDRLQEAVRRGPASAAAVREAMEKDFAQEGAALYRMLCGYSDAGLASGDAAKLVGYLEHKDLAFRVLGFWNLKSITGLGLLYQPEAPEAKRKQSVRKWQERLQSGELLRSKEVAVPEKPAPAEKPSPAARPAAVEKPAGAEKPELPTPLEKPAPGEAAPN
jgi:hypothetical protein